MGALSLVSPLALGPSLLAVPSSLPIDDPVLIFTLALLTFLVTPLLIERARLPGIVGIILAGAAIGPNALGLLERGETIILLGQVGIIYLMFLAGLEIDRRELAESRAESLSFGLLSFVIPQVTGTFVGVFLFGFSWPTALLFASVFASHTLLAFPVISRLGITNNRAVSTTIGGTILTDTLALLVLAIVAAAVGTGLTFGFWLQLAGGLLVFFVGSWLVLPRLASWFFRTVTEDSYFEYLFVMTLLFATAYAAELAQIEAIIGAFLAGLALNPLIPKQGVLMNRIEFVGNALFIPFFLLSVGMLVDLRALVTGIDTLALSAALITMTLVTKYVAAWLAGGLFGYTSAEIHSMFALSAGQAAAALAVTLVGFQLGLFDQTLVNAVVVMILGISVISPAVAERAGREIARENQQKSPDTASRLDRVLIPFSPASRYKEELLSLALFLREPSSNEPIYTVRVVQPDVNYVATDAAIAAVETADLELKSYAAGAEVDLDSQARIGFNIASEVAAAATEIRATTLVVGWDGAPSRRQQMLGTVLDQILRETTQLVFVSRVHEPLNTTTRIRLVLPPDCQHNDGFEEAIDKITILAKATDATIDGLAIDSDPAVFEAALSASAPAVPARVDRHSDWDGLLEVFETDCRPTDMIVCLSARRGQLGWHPELQTLPNRIARLAAGNFAIVYLPTVRADDDRRFLTLRD